MKIVFLVLFFIVNNLFAHNCQNKLFSISTDGKNGIVLQNLVADLSDTCHLNVLVKDNIAKEKLKQEVKYLKLKNQTLDEFLNFILKQNGFFYTLDNNTLLISYIKTQNFKIDYINSIITGATNFSASTQETGGTDDGTNTLKSTFNFDFWKDFELNINKILTAQVDTSYSNPTPIIDKLTGMVTITGTKFQLDRIKGYISELNKRLHKEVLIDVRIYSVRLSNSNQTGINWSKLNLSFGSDSPISKGISASNIIGSSSIFKQGTLTISGLLNFLSSYGQVNSISNPKITTLNNQKAIITVGQTINYSYKTVTTDANGNAIQSDNIDSKFVGILLDITPEMSDKNIVIMSINPSISSVSPTQLNPGLPPDTYEKKLNTIIRVRDGETIILGGLITDETAFTRNGIPILKEIPVVKYLVSSKSKISSREELVFVITPHIINLNKKTTIQQTFNLPNLGGL